MSAPKPLEIISANDDAGRMKECLIIDWQSKGLFDIAGLYFKRDARDGHVQVFAIPWADRVDVLQKLLRQKRYGAHNPFGENSTVPGAPATDTAIQARVEELQRKDSSIGMAHLIPIQGNVGEGRSASNLMMINSLVGKCGDEGPLSSRLAIAARNKILVMNNRDKAAAQSK